LAAWLFNYINIYKIYYGFTTLKVAFIASAAVYTCRNYFELYL